jgi:hypothetical protein
MTSLYRNRLGLFLGLLGSLYLTMANGSVYYSKEEALELAFGKNMEIESMPVFLNDEQVQAIEKQAQTRLESALYTVYVGKQQGIIQAYAAIDSQKVRTQPQTLLIVTDNQGKLTKTEILAFHEPPEYQTAPRWLDKLVGHSPNELILNYGIDGIAGATMSCQSTLEIVRRTLSIVKVAVLGVS